ncbi:hypothetical protein AB0K00_22710 [Dactylosporangium sp. NPDC049525]|uniref:hypothetical protein n=1 Tax=Dactylosporangium sp. NPDC049525 TaxID=3154730 RepID=UPI00343474BE
MDDTVCGEGDVHASDPAFMGGEPGGSPDMLIAAGWVERVSIQIEHAAEGRGEREESVQGDAVGVAADLQSAVAVWVAGTIVSLRSSANRAGATDQHLPRTER